MIRTSVIRTKDEKLEETLRPFFSDHGFKALFEKNAISAILNVLENEVQLFLLDCSDDTEESIDTLRILHKVRPNLLVLVFADDKNVELVKKLTECGILYRLSKPVQLGELDVIIESVNRREQKRTPEWVV